MTDENNTSENEKTIGAEQFWEIIVQIPGKNIRIITDKEESKILEKNKIIELVKDKWLTHKDNLLHFFNVEKKILLSPGHFYIMTYDINFGKLIGKEIAYNLIKDKIFYICEQMIYDKENVNELDKIIKELKNGTYGEIDKLKFWFIDIYPYILSNIFFLRDIVAIEKAKARGKEYSINYGGRCVSLLSIKRVLIDNVPIEESTLEFEEKRLGTTNLKIIMEKNGIPYNKCLSKKVKEIKPAEDYWKL